MSATEQKLIKNEETQKNITSNCFFTEGNKVGQFIAYSRPSLRY